MKVGIIYIAIGEYEKFWDIFYPTCQTYFCVDAEKGYELFTDSERLLSLNYPNVHAHKKADEGFILYPKVIDLRESHKSITFAL